MRRLLPLALFLLLLVPSAQAQAFARQRVLLGDGWRFHLQQAAVLVHASASTDWRFVPAPSAAAGTMPPVGTGVAAQAGTAAPGGTDVFHGRPGFAWFYAALLPLAASGRTVHFASIDDNATVYLNGCQLAAHQGWNDPFSVALDTAWNPQGPNSLAVLVENTAGAGGIAGSVTVGSAAAAVSLAPARPAFDNTRWRTVHLPHDYVVESSFDPNGNAGHGFKPARPAWYRKTFSLPAGGKGRSVWLDFDGVYRDSKVWLNGALLGERPSGYTSFRYDISRAAHFDGPNVLAVSVDPTKFEGWWYEGGGIYRHVWLNVAGTLHIAPDGVAVTASLPEPGAGGVASAASVSVKTDAAYPNLWTVNGPDAVLMQRIAGPHGESAAKKTVSLLTMMPEQTQTFTVASPLLWSLDTSCPYPLRREIRQGTSGLDAMDTPFGIRTLRFDALRGFFLSGKHVEIKGTCSHQDFAGVGVGVPDNLELWRMRKLKTTGCNAWRMPHNPPTQALLDACDRLGMLVMDENRHLGDTYQDHTPAGTPAADLHDLADRVKRDRNYPSIIMWSLCREEGLQGSAEGTGIFARMMQAVRKYDATRPISCAMNGGYGQGISLEEDLQGVNYHPLDYDRIHAARPQMPFFGSETASTVGTRGICATDPIKGYVNAYDTQPGGGWANTAEQAWQPMLARPYVAGGFVWTGFDYRGEPTPYAWPCVSSHFGILGTCGFPKDAFYYYGPVWGDKPAVHMLPHWNWAGREGQPVNVWVYSSRVRVSLTLNGQALGTQTMPPNGYLEWQVLYAPGRLEVRGVAASGAVVVDAVQTTGPPAALRRSTDTPQLAADGESISPVAVSIVDAQGRVVPNASSLVTFHVAGAGQVAGVGNADPSSHKANNGAACHAFNGLCMALVRAGSVPGTICLTATAPGLAPATLVLKSFAP